MQPFKNGMDWATPTHSNPWASIQFKRHCISVGVRLISGIMCVIVCNYGAAQTLTHAHQLMYIRSLQIFIDTCFYKKKIICMDFIIAFICFATAKCVSVCVDACFSILVDSFIWCFAQCGSTTIGWMPQYQFVWGRLEMHSCD